MGTNTTSALLQRGTNLMCECPKLIERCSDGVEDQGAEEAFMGMRELSRQFWKPSPVLAALLSAQTWNLSLPAGTATCDEIL